MTDLLFRENAYTKTCDASVINVREDGGITLNRTIFYPTGGGQPGDSGLVLTVEGSKIKVLTTIYGQNKGEVVHILEESAKRPAIGDKLKIEIDWSRRYKLMRMHTCLHLLSSVLPYPVTGGQVSENKGRLDFDLPDLSHTKEDVTQRINELVRAELDVTEEWISDDELSANPDLVKTMSVKPPLGHGKVRLIRVGNDCDLQPCGGTHVRNTLEIGQVEIRKIEKKGRQNRRVSVQFIE